MGHCHEPVDTHCVDCELPQMERNHYFTGKLLVERDFTDEQRYTMGKLRRHDLRLHGHGVVCGLKVTAHPNPSCQHRYVVVSPGTARGNSAASNRVSASSRDRIARNWS